MKLIKDIMFFHKMHDDEPYSEDDSYYGRIILKEDQSFEGMATDYNQTSLYYLVGKLKNNKMEMLQCSMWDNEIPKSYEAKKEGSRFYGVRIAKSAYAEVPVGECKVVVTDPDLYRDWDLEGEIIGLEEQIRRFKYSIGEETKLLLQTNNSKEKEKTYKKKAQN